MNGQNNFHTFLCRFSVKSRRTSAILRILKILQTWQNSKFSNGSKIQTVHQNWLKLQIMTDNCAPIWMGQKKLHFPLPISIKSRRTSAILRILKILQTWQNSKFLNGSKIQTVHQNRLKLQILADNCAPIWMGKIIFTLFFADFL